MSSLGFSCSYTKLRDVEDESPCGRPATRRAKGAPKCMGHWAGEHLMGMLGGTEHARKTWLWAGGVLLCLAVWGTWAYSVTFTYYTYLTWALAVFSAGLILVTGPEHPLGGSLTLVSAPVIGYALLSNSAALLGLNPFRDAAPPERSAADLLSASVDLATGVIFIGSFVGFLFLYLADDRRELRFYTALNLPLAVLALPCVVTLTVLTHGQYLDVRPWIVVVYVAAVVARGKERVRQLAKRLRV
ncbi:hypothetical protein [Streptomyces pseudogriseolus]|uniref:hypothetical protein n=1 Tax=Streptomyces pseudogriseolus TaxID=36817 RepID=UPI003FA2A4CF